MSYENDAYLNFSLEETILFRQGQEVAQLRSILLEPNVTIEENDEYAFIRGSLHLSGEYDKTAQQQVGQYNYETEQFVQSVLENDDLQCEFSHHFPIDITIPLNRINDLNDLQVQIESFDYEIDDTHRFNLKAELIINGLQQGESEPLELRPSDELLVEEDSYENISQEDNALEANNYEEARTDYLEEDAEQLDSESEETELEEAFRDDEQATIEISEEDKQAFVVEARQGEGFTNVIADRNPAINLSQEIVTSEKIADIKTEIFTGESEEVDYNKITNLFASSNESDRDQLTTEDLQSEVANRSDESNDKVDYYEEPAETDLVTEEVEVSEEEKLAEEETKFAQKKVKKKTLKQKITKSETLSLTEFFSRNDEENGQTKMKLCIVQSGETISYLSDKYRITEQKILQVNKLDLTDEIYEGQVLYIPVKEFD